jgi:hypothetical protein
MKYNYAPDTMKHNAILYIPGTGHRVPIQGTREELLAVREEVYKAYTGSVSILLPNNRVL